MCIIWGQACRSCTRFWGGGRGFGLRATAGGGSMSGRESVVAVGFRKPGRGLAGPHPRRIFRETAGCRIREDPWDAGSTVGRSARRRFALPRCRKGWLGAPHPAVPSGAAADGRLGPGAGRVLRGPTGCVRATFWPRVEVASRRPRPAAARGSARDARPGRGPAPGSASSATGGRPGRGAGFGRTDRVSQGHDGPRDQPQTSFAPTSRLALGRRACRRGTRAKVARPPHPAPLLYLRTPIRFNNILRWA